MIWFRGRKNCQRISENRRIKRSRESGFSLTRYLLWCVYAPREMNISRSNNDPNPEKRKDTYYPEPRISEEAQHEIKNIIWNERQKKAKPAKADKKA